MGNWLTELVNTNRLKYIEKESARPAPWEGRTRAQLIYGRTYNDEEPNWSFGNPPVYWEPQNDGTHTIRLGELSSDSASAATSLPGPMTGSIGQSDAPDTATIIRGEPVISANGRSAASPFADGWSLGTGGANILAPRRINQNPGEQDRGRITLVNDEDNGRVLDREIDSKLAGLVEAYVAESGRSVNINSTIRDLETDRTTPPHYMGFGVDINKIDGQPVKADEPLVRELVDFLKSRKDSFQIIGPTGGFERVNDSFTRKKELEKGHDTHIHPGVGPNRR